MTTRGAVRNKLAMLRQFSRVRVVEEDRRQGVTGPGVKIARARVWGGEVLTVSLPMSSRMSERAGAERAVVLAVNRASAAFRALTQPGSACLGS